MPVPLSSRREQVDTLALLSPAPAPVFGTDVICRLVYQLLVESTSGESFFVQNGIALSLAIFDLSVLTVTLFAVIVAGVRIR